MNEIWKDINGYDGKYQISNLGNIRSFSRWKNGALMKPTFCGKPGPYKKVVLVKTGRKDKKQEYIHRLVATHFIPNPDNLSEVNHIDGDTLNNIVDNLEWCTRQYNAKHASEHGLLSLGHKKGSENVLSKAVIQKSIDGTFVKEWGAITQIQRETGFRTPSIIGCCKHRRKTAHGFLWEYKNGEANDKNQGKEKHRERKL